MNAQHVTVDLTKAPTYAQMVTIGQGDASGTTIVADVYDNGQAVSLAGMSARFCMRFPNDGGYVRDAGCTVSGSQITYVVDESKCASVSGRADECYFEILNGAGTVKYSTSRFRVMVLRAADSGTDAARTWDSDYEVWKRGKDAQVGATINAANAAVQAMRQDVDGIVAQADDAIDRAEDAIDAMGDISELAVPLMTTDTRGGAKLGRGLVVEDGSLSVQLDAESDGTDAGPISELTAKGHSEQASTTGKNLLENKATSQTANGVTFTVNADGSVTANGTATADVLLSIIGSSNLTLPAGTYTISGVPNGSATTYDYYIPIKTSSSASWTQLVCNDFLTFAVGDGNSIGINVRIRNGVTVSNLTFYPQVELGSTATSYEPYTGGAPSPSPDYPQEIQVVRGRNLLQNNATSQTVNGVTFTVNADGSVTANGTASGGDVMLGVTGSGNITLPAGTYTISGVPSGSTSTYDYYIPIKASSSSSWTQLMCNNSLTFTVGDGNSISINVRIRNGITVSNLTFRPQIERGSVAHGYVPYGDYVGLEAQGKNLLQNFATTETVSGVTFTVNDDGTITANGTATADATCYLFGASTNTEGTVFLPDATYTVSMGTETNDLNWAIKTSGNLWISKPTTRSLSGTVLAFWVQVKSGGTVNNLVIKPQLEKGSTVTPYQPYYRSTNPIPLPSRGWVGSLPDGTADTLTLDGAGKVTWTRATKEAVLDGVTNQSLGLTNPLTGANGYRATFTLPDQKNVGSAANTNFYVSHGKPNVKAEFTNQWQIGNAMMYGTGFFLVQPESTNALCNTWLQSHPVTVLYPLATPVTEEMGYVDLPDIPEGASLSIPELDALGVKYLTDDAAVTMARQWYERAKSEYADRIAALEEAVAEIIAGA